VTRKDRLTQGLLEIANAKPGTTADAIRSVAGDIALNCITPDVVQHHLTRRSAAPAPPVGSAPTEDEYLATIDRLQAIASKWRGNEAYGRTLQVELHMVMQYRRLDLGVRAIRRAAAMGSVCDDVAWFDTITTLLDYCSILLGDDVDLGAITAPAYPHPSRRPRPPQHHHQRPVLKRRKAP
jgi:hypothetical protein